MEYRSAFDRIDGCRDIEFISRNICNDYKFGNYLGYKIIDVGYEDFNYILTTDLGNYFVKIFNTDRDDTSRLRLISILTKAIKNGVSTPKIYSINNEYIYNIIVNKQSLKLFVMECIDGNSLYELNRDLNLKELDQIAIIASKINTIDFEIAETYYDEWTLTNLESEYNKKSSYLDSEDRKNIKNILKKFKKIDICKLKHSYIHGDMIKANLMIDKSGKLYVIDFSAFNYMPRIMDLIVILLGDCLNFNKKDTLKKINHFLNSYNKLSKLDSIEIESIPIFIKALASMFIIQSSYIKKTLGDYVENDYWLAIGREALYMDIEKSDIKIEDVDI